MNLPAIAVVLLLLAQSGDTSALVEASKASKSKRKSSTTKVITNADVKKADKSRITVRKDGEAAPVEKQPTLMETHEAERKTRAELDAKLKVLDETIAGLEKELARLEQTYYETNDLEYRDKQLVARFNETQLRLGEARAEREALTPKPRPDPRLISIE